MMNKIVALATTLLVAGCTVDKAEIPAVTGPSEFGLSVTLSATPDQLPRDGSSQSIITVVVRDASSRPVSGQLLSIATNIGTVSATQIVTESDGRATFAFVAPSPETVGNRATIQVMPISTDAANAAPRSVQISLTGIPNNTTPIPDFTPLPSSPERNTVVRFDASATKDENTPCLDACTYEWNFGDGTTGSGRIVTHTFTSGGTFTVTLTVTDAAGSSASTAKTITVTNVAVPTVTLVVSPNPPLANQTAVFTATTTVATGHSIVRYVWNFGDGTSQTTSTATATKTYSAIGTYVATVTVTDDVGQSASGSTSFTIVGTGVTASFTFSPTGPKTGDTVQFNGASSTGPAGATITEWAWDFGDGSTSTESGATTSHAFATARTFVVRLTVKDSAGRTGTTTREVAVTAP